MRRPFVTCSDGGSRLPVATWLFWPGGVAASPDRAFAGLQSGLWPVGSALSLLSTLCGHRPGFCRSLGVPPSPPQSHGGCSHRLLSCRRAGWPPAASTLCPAPSGSSSAPPQEQGSLRLQHPGQPSGRFLHQPGSRGDAGAHSRGGGGASRLLTAAPLVQFPGRAARAQRCHLPPAPRGPDRRHPGRPHGAPGRDHLI